MLRPALSLLALAPLLMLAACGGSSGYTASSSGTSSGGDRHRVTGGGYALSSGEPAWFYGTVTTEGVGRYTYLVVARGMAPDVENLLHTDEGTTSSDSEGLSSDHTLTVQGVTLHATFTATLGPTGLTDQTTTLNGQELADGQWLFLFDAADPSSALIPVDAESPDVSVGLEELPEFTQAHVGRLIESNETVRSFVDGSR